MKRTAIAIAVGALSIGISQGLLAEEESAQQNEQQKMNQEGGEIGQESQGQGTEVRVEGEPADVNVEQEPAEIRVEQQSPDVTVEQQPPKVTIEQPDPNVTVEQAEPNVTVEQTGEADVEVERAEEAEAEMRDPDEEDPAQEDPEQNSQDHQSADGNDLTNMKVSEIEGYAVYSQEDDDEIGDVERVVRDTQNNDIYVVISQGGFLGFGKDEMGYKLDDLQIRNDDELVVRSSDDGESGDYGSDKYEDLDGNQTLSEAMQRN
ncbi:DUF6470 family protein [Halomonas sp. LR5S13]|uniref:DUF6470 family protein n=1 Tax=Halomonas rhizosphaerae TaxID=3043296 RepID=UPI0024A81831|nr:DUF6470 family protein [Halomonas rhizosphaerae]MDI5919642.1 DUF6470 family protein [Halomonas rhizosphaerae]